MSIFDPQALYYHRQKKTHKGQVIQKKPVDVVHAYSNKMIPNAISVLKTYGYSVYPPGEDPPSPPSLDADAYFNAPFSIKYAPAAGSVNTSVNSIWPFLVQNIPNLSTFVENHPSAPNGSTVSIAITSLFYAYVGKNFNILVYANNTLNIQATINEDVGHGGGVLLMPDTASTYLLAQDTAIGAEFSRGDILFLNRTSEIAVQGVLGFTTFHDRWDQLNSQSGLQTDIYLQSGQPNPETTQFTLIIINGTMSVKINGN